MIIADHLIGKGNVVDVIRALFSSNRKLLADTVTLCYSELYSENVIVQ